MSAAIHHAILKALRSGAPGLAESVRTAIATAIGINLRAIREPGIRRDDMQKLTTATASDDDQAYALDWLRHQIEIVDDQIAKVGGDNPAKTLLAMIEPGTPAARWREKGEADPHGDTDHYKGDRARLAHGNMTDDELANSVFLDPHIGHLTAAKERIRWLSRKLIEVQQAAALPVSGEIEPTPNSKEWEVSVSVAGQTILTIGHNHLSGHQDIDTYAEIVRSCAQHLTSFIGDVSHPQAPASGERETEIANLVYATFPATHRSTMSGDIRDLTWDEAYDHDKSGHFYVARAILAALSPSQPESGEGILREALAARCYSMSEGARLIIGFETIKAAGDAQQALSTAAPRP